MGRSRYLAWIGVLALFVAACGTDDDTAADPDPAAVHDANNTIRVS
jgi:hypothetical protein